MTLKKTDVFSSACLIGQRSFETRAHRVIKQYTWVIKVTNSIVGRTNNSSSKYRSIS